MSQTEQLSRWRLILGAETEESFSGMGGAPLSQEELHMILGGNAAGLLGM